ncbi:hypothetical protein ACFODL_06385 [Phenylobacterium terrae]|uniref:Uncharacterized protein n=1 Tax=Phenylobacterium terrae TaxID=2665495 RepID=A0ABW4N683_9CAUL
MDVETLRARLGKLDECLIVGFRMDDFLSSLQITLDDIWTEQGQVRADLGQRRKLLRLSCELVERIEFLGGLRAHNLIASPELIGWSHTEVSAFELGVQPSGLLRLRMTITDARSITVDCARIRVVEPDTEID